MGIFAILQQWFYNIYMLGIIIIYVIFVLLYFAYGYVGIYQLRKMDCMDLTSEDAISIYKKASIAIVIITVLVVIFEYIFL